jgi:threonine aldolase
MNTYANARSVQAEQGHYIDLRSDTVTTPVTAMRQAMADAVVGDDVYGDDPTANHLQARIADMLGKEAGLFVSSGTMSNLIAMLVHCQRGDEIITGRDYHVYCDEAGGASIVGGMIFDPLDPADDGALEASDILAAVKPDDIHCPISRLLCLENTWHGAAISLDRIKASAAAGRTSGMNIHLDGARFFNAVTALGISPADLAGVADTVSVCLSKGLGAPAGSILCGSEQFIKKALRVRKYLGGGMRQIGILAAAGLYALDHHIDRLPEDHARASDLAQFLSTLPGLSVRTATNMVFLSLATGSAEHLADTLADQGVVIMPGGAETRLVMHVNIDDAALDRIKSAFKHWHEKQNEL